MRARFPIFDEEAEQPLVYLDHAASSQKPQEVIDAIAGFYARDYSNIHRGIHRLSMIASDRYEDARTETARFINAPTTSQVVFVRGTTEAINLVAQSYGEQILRPNDEVLISEMEHHSNIVPWQIVCRRSGARLRVIPITNAGELDLDALDNLLGPQTKIVSVCHVSNVLGTINPIQEVARRVHAAGAVLVVDGAQAITNTPVDVTALRCDFYCFSAHKIYGPTGIGVLYGRDELLARMPPYQGGGGMIESVGYDSSTYADIPSRFEAGTPHIAGAVGLNAAIQFLRGVGEEQFYQHGRALASHALERLAELPRVRLLGRAAHRAPILTLAVDDIHAHDLATLLDENGIAVRAGHHCATPLLDKQEVSSAVRLSCGIYNTLQEIDFFFDQLAIACTRLGKPIT
ncbi:MAG: cysteine desulfurase [Methylobacter sp.]|nr:cysteine desulfurase [Methylobacter sp.]